MKKLLTLNFALKCIKKKMFLFLARKYTKIYSRLRPEVWQHTDLNLSKPTNIGCPNKM